MSITLKEQNTRLSRADEFDVAISGASYAGLALARALSLTFNGEARIAVFDRAVPSERTITDVRAFAITAS